MSYLNIRYCKKCRQAYDIGTNLPLCPVCRKEKAMSIAVNKDKDKQYINVSNSNSSGIIMDNVHSRRLWYQGSIPCQRTATNKNKEGENGKK